MAKENPTPEMEEDKHVDTEEILEDPRKMVKVRIPKLTPNEEPNFYVAINGVNYLIPKGKLVEVPAFIKEEIERSEAAKEKFFNTVEDMSQKERK